jgi:hypothetical protein
MSASTSDLAVTAAITGGISVITSLLLARLKFQFVRRPELAEEVTNQLDLERGKRELDREERVRQQVILWAHPISETSNDLIYRLTNIYDNDGHVALSRVWDSIRPSDWSATHDYFLESTMYLFGRYFACIELLRSNLGLDFYPSQTDKDLLFDKFQRVTSALSRYPAVFNENNCPGGDRQVFLLEQRAIGEAFVDSATGRPISYSEYLSKTWMFNRRTEPLRQLLLDLSPEPHCNCRWLRIDSVRPCLREVQLECERLIGLVRPQ